MGATLTDDGWRFADTSRTTAEIVLAMYRALRGAAGDAILIGCNTFSHLSAGLFEVNRIGDDTSGRSWDRTRRMGVNTLAFRAAHHGTFYAADPDIAAITRQHPWTQGRLWLRLLGESGMPAFVSPEIEAVTPDAKRAMADAFSAAASAPPVAEPLDWLETVCPRRWRLRGRVTDFDWSVADGPWPFSD
jgi:alpha-galactosidase